MKVRFAVSVLSGTAFPHRRDLEKLAELVRIIDDSGVELIGTNDTSFIGGDAYVRQPSSREPPGTPRWVFIRPIR